MNIHVHEHVHEHVWTWHCTWTCIAHEHEHGHERTCTWKWTYSISAPRGLKFPHSDAGNASDFCSGDVCCLRCVIKFRRTHRWFYAAIGSSVAQASLFRKTFGIFQVDGQTWHSIAAVICMNVMYMMHTLHTSVCVYTCIVVCHTCGHAHTHRETDRQTDGRTDRHACRHTDMHACMCACIDAYMHACPRHWSSSDLREQTYWKPVNMARVLLIEAGIDSTAVHGIYIYIYIYR